MSQKLGLVGLIGIMAAQGAWAGNPKDVALERISVYGCRTGKTGFRFHLIQFHANKALDGKLLSVSNLSPKVTEDGRFLLEHWGSEPLVLGQIRPSAIPELLYDGKAGESVRRIPGHSISCGFIDLPARETVKVSRSGGLLDGLFGKKHLSIEFDRGETHQFLNCDFQPNAPTATCDEVYVSWQSSDPATSDEPGALESVEATGAQGDESDCRGLRVE